ncbi:hypothetical protein [Sphingomonas bacterium]|uniref:hypothetical protein n=1 Tax=Sphingomonas bacterium TaxID=1895847 RepID=UPI0015776956|nr:hypothetical protein [Sphingomonas bacterium]
MRSLAIIAAVTFASPAFAQAPTAPACVGAGTWSYGGTGKGSTTAQPGAASTLIEFTPDKKDKQGAAAFIMTVDAGPPGVYQLNADFDVRHLGDDATFTLTGAASAIPGREFDVKIVKGDDGSSSFSRPVTTTGAPFTVELHTKGAVAMTVRNVKLCRLR